MPSNIEKLKPNRYYHIYNHAISKENIFLSEENYYFFLGKYGKYLNSILDTFAFCLLPNHFHFAVRVKSEVEILKLLGSSETSEKLPIETIISRQFGRLFSSYSQAFNKQQNRKGPLFVPNFKRTEVTKLEYYKNLIHYVHYNPVYHGFAKDLKKWKFSSYESFFSSKTTKLKREIVIKWFENKKEFYYFHKKEIDEKMFFDLEYI